MKPRVELYLGNHLNLKNLLDTLGPDHRVVSGIAVMCESSTGKLKASLRRAQAMRDECKSRGYEFTPVVWPRRIGADDKALLAGKARYYSNLSNLCHTGMILDIEGQHRRSTLPNSVQHLQASRLEVTTFPFHPAARNSPLPLEVQFYPTATNSIGYGEYAFNKIFGKHRPKSETGKLNVALPLYGLRNQPIPPIEHLTILAQHVLAAPWFGGTLRFWEAKHYLAGGYAREFIDEHLSSIIEPEKEKDQANDSVLLNNLEELRKKLAEAKASLNEAQALQQAIQHHLQK